MDSAKFHIFEILAREHESMLLAYALSLIPDDPQLAEDVVQETFLIAYRKIATLRKEDAFGLWLRGIARFEAYAALRKRGRERTFDPAVLEGIEDVFGTLEKQQADCWQDRVQLVEDCFPDTGVNLLYRNDNDGWTRITAGPLVAYRMRRMLGIPSRVSPISVIWSARSW